MYLEGSDQHRGWFHSSLLVSVGNDGMAPYRSVLTHGFVVDGKGRKMSKSLGNIIAPEEIIEKYGAEILRLWVTYEDYRDDIKMSKEIVDRLVETYRRIGTLSVPPRKSPRGFRPGERHGGLRTALLSRPVAPLEAPEAS